ncbi:hypothetical protein HYFRA_00012327 [Hymenoscyphus fraxineus]|uniref:Transcription initiation factor TFIID subunit 2 n=1 Tax=Hymenoscyphus fraxineus TaxID=746836 RepID=A0A9N9PWR1_9HELO|nr:hypothetical protein HYFRA_00012327 [Hymenoscyphus fraxineus]
MPSALPDMMDLDDPMASLAEVVPAKPLVPVYGFLVSHQKLDIHIDFPTQTLTGRTEITILPQVKDLEYIRIDARQCTIEDNHVSVEGVEAYFEYEDPMKKMNLPLNVDWSANQAQLQQQRISCLTTDQRANGSLVVAIPRSVRIQEVDHFSDKAGTPVSQRAALNGAPLSATPVLTPKVAADQSARYQPLKVSIQFTTKNFRDGLHFVGLNEGDARFPNVYTRHSIDPGTASCIFPCVDDPAMRSTWDINIKCSRTLGEALKRKPVKHHKAHTGKKDPARGNINGVKPTEDCEINLSEDEKLLEMVVLCSGEPIREAVDVQDSTKKIMSFECARPVAPQHIGFAIGPFEQVDLTEYREDENAEKLGQSGLKILGYCLPGRSSQLRHTASPLTSAMDEFTLTFGAYPFSQYSIVFVDDQIRDTEHTASLSLCSTRLLVSEDIIEPEVESIRTLVHAGATQWFGVAMVPNQPKDRWITIGLSHYMTGLFMKLLCGANDYFYRQKTLSDRVVEEDIERPSIYNLGEILHLGEYENEFMALKAPLVCFILDKRILKATGTYGLTRVVSRLIISANTGMPEDSVLTTKEFRRFIEKITKYRQTESFWDQWVYGAGCPRFVISTKFNKKKTTIDMNISQCQDTEPTQRLLKKDSFPREVKEEVNKVYAGEVQTLFTGPLTIRVHEADGTPYEHIVEIDSKNHKIEIPYYTKYKRLKRNRRQNERQNAGAEGGEDGEDALYYCLGDNLQTPEEIAEWELGDWDEAAEARMAQESYEWLRIDSDFEWLCHKKFNEMPAYMYVSQLQQDRDIVAQQESMLYLAAMPDHKLVATFLIRTLMDVRYYYGIRAMAAKLLKVHATKKVDWVGLRQLEKAFQEFSCYKDTLMPRPNDFEDKRQYYVDKAIPEALSEIRDMHGKCPKKARQLIMDMLKFNVNGDNTFSDQFKVANLLSCLATSLMPKERPANEEVFVAENQDEDEDEPEQFKRQVLDQLDRYRRMDEWIDSYQNIYTTTVLDAYYRLMKSKVIPLDPVDFVQYLHDGTSDLVRIKAFESLIDLGFITNDQVCKLLLKVVSTDNSPYTRTHLFEVFCIGLASVAFGHHKEAEALAQPEPESNAGDLTIEDGLTDERVEARKLQIARTTTIDGALHALKSELKNNEVLKEALWDSIKSTSTGPFEQLDLLDISAILYDHINTMILKLRLPRYRKAVYKATKPKEGQTKVKEAILVLKETPKVRTKPLSEDMVVKKLAASNGLKYSLATIVPEPLPPPVAQPVSVKIQAPAPKPQITQTSSTPAPGPVRISLTKLSSSASKPGPLTPNPISSTPKPSSSMPKPISSSVPKSGAGSMKPPKRPLDAEGVEENPPKKRRRIVRLKVPGDKVQAILRTTPRPEHRSISKSSSVRSSPAPGVSRPSPRPSPAVATTSTSTISVSAPAPSSMANNAPSKPRKPLPDAVPKHSSSPSGSSGPSSGRKPLPDASGRKVLTGSVSKAGVMKPYNHSTTSSAHSANKSSHTSMNLSNSATSASNSTHASVNSSKSATPPPKKSKVVKLKVKVPLNHFKPRN